MNEIELTQLFVEYAETQKKLSELKTKIEIEILARGESSKIAGITATYYKPSFGTPDYEEAAKAYLEEYPQEAGYLEKFQIITVNTKWKEICVDFGISPAPGEEKPARVVIK
jgi:hypothetical protein